MHTTVEGILDALRSLQGMETAVIGEATEGLLLDGLGDNTILAKLVRHQAYIFQLQADMLGDVGLAEGMSESLLTLRERYHIARFFTGDGMEGLFLYAVFHQSAKLGMVRVKLAEITQNAVLSPDERKRLLQAARNEEAGEYATTNPFDAPAPQTPTLIVNPMVAATPSGPPGSPAAIRLGRLKRLLHLSHAA